MSFLHPDDAWASPFHSEVSTEPVSAKVVETPAPQPETASEDAITPSGDVLTELRAMRREQAYQSYCIMGLLALQAALMFMYLERVRRDELRWRFRDLSAR